MYKARLNVFLPSLLLILWSSSSFAQLSLDLAQAKRLAQLPIDCVVTEYPNKLGQVLADNSEMGEPKQLHPAFYGCFDWHSAVHGHWSMVRLLARYPKLEQADAMRAILRDHLSKENIDIEIAYFMRDSESSYERTYGWAWLLKLQQELNEWQDPLADSLAANLRPLTELLSQRYLDYLPRLVYPIRVGEHSNTGFGNSFAWDYAASINYEALLNAISSKALAFFAEDENCPIAWEPSGYDFLSPCLEEIDLMRRILDEQEFLVWLGKFMPQIMTANFSLQPGQVLDRSDGKLVHLDGLNFSRAWVLYGLARDFPQLQHLKAVADTHINFSLENLFGDSYEGGHWLGSFAIYALGEQ